MKRLRDAPRKIYLTDPTWVNHEMLFTAIGLEVGQLPYYKDGAFDFESYIDGLRQIKPSSAVVLHTCAHNPTGFDPSREQWKAICGTIVERKLYPIFDSAYLGFNSGSFDADAWPIRHLLDSVDVEFTVCLSMAKNMGLYGERVGLVACVSASSAAAEVAMSVLQRVQRSTISAPPAYGARIAARVLGTPSIRAQWSQDLVVMSQRIQVMRRRLFDELLHLQTPGDWSFIIEQTGMFAYLGISKSQISNLEGKSQRVSNAGNR